MKTQFKSLVLSMLCALAAGVVSSEPISRQRAELKQPAEITTDKIDYEPGSTALILGSGFQPNENVVLQVIRIDGTPVSGEPHVPWPVQANNNGDFLAQWTVCNEDCPGFELQLVASGQNSGFSATAFLRDGIFKSGLDLAPSHLAKGQSSFQLQGWFNLSQQWGGTIQASNSRFSEGNTIPLRFYATLPAGSTNTVLLKYDFSSGGAQRFFDYLTSFNASVTNAIPLAGINGAGTPTLWSIPADTSLPSAAQASGNLNSYNIASLTFGHYTLVNGVKVLPVIFTVASGGGNKTVVLVYGGHLASAAVWGPNNGASQFPGASTKAYASFGGSPDLNVAVNPGTIVPSADLAIVKTVSPNPVFSGDNITYQITVTNSGPDAAASVIVNDPLPGGLVLVSASGSQGTNNGINPLIFNLGTLNPQASARLTILARVTLSSDGLITNTASVSSTTLDPNATNNQASVVITVKDRNPPLITCPADIVTGTSPGQCSTVVNFAATATDDEASLILSYNPPPGSLFQEGTNSVLCTVTDPDGNTAHCTFRVIVLDTEPPQISCPRNLVVNTDPNLCTAVVNYQVTVSDNCPGVTYACNPPSGSAFPLGTTLVTCMARDAAGNTSSCSFTVTVVDKQAPQIACPADIVTTVDAGSCFATVTFPTPLATDNCGGNVPVVCSPPSGSTFGVGTNPVVCTATDAAGNVNTCAFSVIVNDAPNQTWPNAQPLTLVANSGVQQAAVQQCINSLDQSRWFKFQVQPGSRVVVTLTQLPENYDLVLFKDIGAAYDQLASSSDLAHLSAEFAGDAFSPSAFSPSAFSPSAFSPSAFSPSAFSPSAFSPSAFSPSAFSPSAFSPSAFSPDAFAPSAFSPSAFSPSAFSPSAFSPSAFSPSAFSPSAFSAAQIQSVVAVSAFDGIESEGVVADTWDNAGNFYIRVRGRNGVFSTANPFQLTVYQFSSGCNTLSTVPLDASGQPLPPSTTAAPAGNYRTIILTDLNRWLGSGPSTAKANITSKLALLAARPEVKGVVVDVGSDPWVAAFNVQADTLFDCPLAKNLVAGAIKAIVDRSRAGNALQYVVIVGNDGIIPFFRFPDEALLGPEENYVPPVKDLSASQASLRLNYVLNQDGYGAQCSLSLKTLALPLPDLAVGRLVESADEVSGMIDAYLSTPAGVLPSPTSSFVSGYDFLADDATAVASELALGMGLPGDTLICPNTSAPSLCWTADNLRQALFSKRHDLIFLAGHFSASEALAADFTTHVFASELAASANSFSNSIIFSAGCHSGYNIVDADDITGVTAEPDWIQACLRKQATVIAGTGYQYGDTDFIEYSERLYLEFAQQLRTGQGPVPVGQALLNAKRVYLAATPEMRGIHTKAYLEATLFGLPMLGVNMGGARRSADVITPIVSSVQPVAGNPGATLGLQYADVTLTPSLTPTPVTLNDTSKGSQVIATYLAGGDGVINNSAEPILPLEVRNVSVPNVVLRGLGFRGGTYHDLLSIIPLTGAPTTSIRGVHATFLSEVFYPMRPWNVNYFGAICAGLDGNTRLMAIPAQFKSDSATAATGTLRQFSEMDFRLFYSANITTYTDANGGNPSTPALAAAPAISAVTGITSPNGSTVALSANVVGNPAAGIQAVWVTYTATAGPLAGYWQSLDLVQNAADSRVWQASLPLNGTPSQSIRYMVQAVNGVGVVALDTKLGAYHTPDEFDSGAIGQLAPTTVTLLNPPTTGPYGTTVQCSARLTTSAGSPLAQQRMIFSMGGQEAWATTDATGLATAGFPLRSVPGSYTLTASFPGAAGYAPSFTTAPFTITRQGTVLNLAPPVAYAWSNADTKVFANLTDSAGTPIFERTVFLNVNGANGNYARSIMSDINGSVPLGPVPLPVGTYTVNSYFNGTIPLTGGRQVNIDDGIYFPSTANSTLIIEAVLGITASPNVLWPANHNMVPVTLTVTLSPNAGAVTSSIVSVASSDPTNTTGDGNTGGDWFVTGPLTVQLRAERASSSVGRTYTITVQSIDPSGNSTTGTATVFVPPDQSN